MKAPADTLASIYITTHLAILKVLIGSMSVLIEHLAAHIRHSKIYYPRNNTAHVSIPFPVLPNTRSNLDIGNRAGQVTDEAPSAQI